MISVCGTHTAILLLHHAPTIDDSGEVITLTFRSCLVHFTNSLEPGIPFYKLYTATSIVVLPLNISLLHALLVYTFDEVDAISTEPGARQCRQ